MYYFAYGSNMSAGQMQRRCPGSKPLGAAELDCYGLRFDGKCQNWSDAAVANITPRATEVVWGVLYDVTEAHLRTLDSFEYVPVNYRRFLVSVKSAELGSCKATTYMRAPRSVGTPTVEYLSTLLDGGRENGLPADYLAGLVRLAGAGGSAREEMVRV
jgi:gamma-glutamylcyclotransferase